MIIVFNGLMKISTIRIVYVTYVTRHENKLNTLHWSCYAYFVRSTIN